MAKKLINQSLIDFVVNNYGGLDQIETFIKANDIAKYDDFTDSNSFILGDVKPTTETEFYQSNNVLVATGEIGSPLPDFNNDFNDDFLI